MGTLTKEILTTDWDELSGEQALLDLPIKYKLMVMETYFTRMYGVRMFRNLFKNMIKGTESYNHNFLNAWDELSRRIKRNVFKKYCKEIAEYEYPLLLKSGMFYEFFPDLSGDWDKDKEEFIKFIEFRERWKKENT